MRSEIVQEEPRLLNGLLPGFELGFGHDDPGFLMLGRVDAPLEGYEGYLVADA